MKKRKIYLIIVGFIIIILFCTLFKNLYDNRNISIRNSKYLWTIHDNYLENIKNNLEEISSPNEYFEWWELRDFDIDDEYYKQFLNNLLADLRMHYLYSTDYKMMYDSLKTFYNTRKKDTIPIKEFKNIGVYITIDDFSKYNGLWISKDDEKREEILEKLQSISSVTTSELFIKENKTYDDMLLMKVIDTSYCSSLSDFLRAEYYRLK